MFGYWNAYPEKAICGWGARAIVECSRRNYKFNISLLWDRQNTKGDEADVDRFTKKMNSGILKKFLKKATELFDSCQVATSDNTQFNFEFDGVCFACNPNGSYGYLYIVAFVMDRDALMTEKEQELFNGDGPTRVVTEVPVYGTTPIAAKTKGIESDVVFMRDDNWSLGAPLKFAEEAEELWNGSWIGYYAKPGVEYKTDLKRLF